MVLKEHRHAHTHTHTHTAREQVGVGLVLKERSDGCHIVKRLKPGQAAAHCGQIEAGDLLTHVDSLDIARGDERERDRDRQSEREGWREGE